MHGISSSFVVFRSQLKTEDYIIEFTESDRRSYTQVTIFRRPFDEEYYGQLYVDKNRDPEREKTHPMQSGSVCFFRLGSQQAMKKYAPHSSRSFSPTRVCSRYIDQFTEILTENGRKSVKITHQRPGQAARVTYTPAIGARTHHQQHLHQNHANVQTKESQPAAPPAQTVVVAQPAQQPPVQQPTTTHSVQKTIVHAPIRAQLPPQPAPQPVQAQVQPITQITHTPTVSQVAQPVQQTVQIQVPTLPPQSHQPTSLQVQIIQPQSRIVHQAPTITQAHQQVQQVQQVQQPQLIQLIQSNRIAQPAQTVQIQAIQAQPQPQQTTIIQAPQIVQPVSQQVQTHPQIISQQPVQVQIIQPQTHAVQTQLVSQTLQQSIAPIQQLQQQQAIIVALNSNSLAGAVYCYIPQ